MDPKISSHNISPGMDIVAVKVQAEEVGVVEVEGEV